MESLTDRISVHVEAVLLWVAARSASLQSTLLWSLTYIFILSIMYLFHSPFRVHNGTDWYAQVTKTLQIWIAVVFVFFHLGPFLTNGLAASASSSSSSPSSPGGTHIIADISSEDSIAAVFFPVLCSASILFLFLHKIKRSRKLGVTYGPSFFVILFNSILLAVFSTTHYAYCLQLRSAHLPSAVAAVRTVVCPVGRVEEYPFFTISYLLVLNIIFVFADYRYKAASGFDPSRGILWSELYDIKKTRSSDTRRSGAGGGAAATLLYWATWLNLWKGKRARQPLDYRSLEPKPSYVHVNPTSSRHHTASVPLRGTAASPVSGLGGSSETSYIHMQHPATSPRDRHTTNTGNTLTRQVSRPYNANHIDSDQYFEVRAKSMEQIASLVHRDSSSTEMFTSSPESHQLRYQAAGTSPSASAPAAAAAAVSFAPTALEVSEIEAAKHPINQPGMVPWWSTFIMSTTWQATARGALEFLTFDVRLLHLFVSPKLFHLHFAPTVSQSVMADSPKERASSSSFQQGHSVTNNSIFSDTAFSEAGNNNGNSNNTGDVWFDWIADVGDGFNSTYEMARLLAQPSLHLPRTGFSASKLGDKRKKASDGTADYQLYDDAPHGKKRYRGKKKPGTGGNNNNSKDGTATPGTGPAVRRSASFAAPPINMSLSASVSDMPSTSNPGWAGPADTVNRRASATTDFDTTATANRDGSTTMTLPRGSFVLIGGDLAYPNPTDETYQSRLFEPYRDALRGNHELRKLFHERQRSIVVPDAEDVDVAHISMLDASTIAKLAKKGDSRGKRMASVEEALRSIPLLFAIPGNHDWFDGLSIFRKYIIEKTWIGGWLMPQRSSFFVLKLPHNWFILCGDTGTNADFDVAQRNYFLDVIEKYMDESSCVILTCHEPGWIYEAMVSRDSSLQPEVNRVANALGTRLRLRMCGDIHHYSRHIPCDALSEAPTLVVSGGGGAFLHGARRAPVVSQGTEYMREAAFPQRNTYLSLASRLIGFRVINWKFDLFVGGFCFLAIVSLLPHPFNTAEMADVKSVPEFVVAWMELTARLIDSVFSKGVCSLVAVGVYFLLFSAAGAEKGFPLWVRSLHSTCWTFVVVLICCGMLAYLECILTYLSLNDMLESRDGRWGSVMEEQVLATTDALLNHTRVLLGPESTSAAMIYQLQKQFYGSKLVRTFSLMVRCLDPMETLAHLSIKVSSDTMGTFASDTTRTEMVLYYLHILFFYWVLVTPLVSIVIGTYLFFSATVLDSLYDAAYSAFQIEDFKSFIRFRIDGRTRELHGYVVAEKRVPKVWELDPKHLQEMNDKKLHNVPPHLRPRPSRWRSAMNVNDGNEGAEVLEHFVCRPHRQQQEAGGEK